MRETTSRRNLLFALAGLTTAAALPALPAVPSQAEILPPVPIPQRSSDPVFAAIERWRRLDEIATAMNGTDFEAAATLAEPA